MWRKFIFRAFEGPGHGALTHANMILRPQLKLRWPPFSFVGRYQDQDNSTEVACKPQPVCGQGRRVIGLSVTTQATCEMCRVGQYQPSASHRSAACINRVATCTSYEWRNLTEAADPSKAAACQLKAKCTFGQFLSGASNGTAAGTCKACMEGQYKDKEAHHDESCTPQGTCGAGQHVAAAGGGLLGLGVLGQGAAAANKLFGSSTHTECRACPAGKFQDTASHTLAECTEWHTCNASSYLHAPTAVSGGACTACPPGATVGESNHRSQACKGPGTVSALGDDTATGTGGTGSNDGVPTESIAAIIVVAFFVVSIVAARIRSRQGSSPSKSGADAQAQGKSQLLPPCVRVLPPSRRKPPHEEQ